MNKSSESLQKYCIQSETHTIQIPYGLCSLLEHQSLVDIAICCGSNVLHAHKVVLAANSPFFREEFEQNPNIEQVVLSGTEFTVIRSLIEFMYCGETYISEDLIKHLVAFGRMLQMKILEKLANDINFSGGVLKTISNWAIIFKHILQNLLDDFIVLPQPQFLTKKPKYPAFPFNTPSPPPPCSTPLKPINYNMNLYKPSKKRKVRDEAEHQACLKEALASRRAIANLKKEIGIAPQPSTFIIEDTCTETTVENFIPNSDGSGFVELDLNGQIVLPQNQQFSPEIGKPNIIQLTLPNGEQNLTAEKIKKILGNQANSNVEIMFRTNDGNFVTVTDDVLQNLQKDGLQYQVIDEEGRIGEVQELHLLNKDHSEKIEKSHSEEPVQFFTTPKISELSNVEPDMQNSIVLPLLNENEMAQDVKPVQDFEVTHFFKNPKIENDSMSITENILLENSKFSPDMFFAESGENGDHCDKKKNFSRKSILPTP